MIQGISFSSCQFGALVSGVCMERFLSRSTGSSKSEFLLLGHRFRNPCSDLLARSPHVFARAGRLAQFLEEFEEGATKGCHALSLQLPSAGADVYGSLGFRQPAVRNPPWPSLGSTRRPWALTHQMPTGPSKVHVPYWAYVVHGICP